MTDNDRVDSSNETLALEEEDRLPWLEPVNDVDEENTVSPGRLIGLVLGGLGALALLVGAIWWMQNRNTNTSGEGELIAAAEGDYKVAPTESGAPEFKGEGDSSYKTSEGGNVDGKIDPSKAPEAPAVTKPGTVPAKSATPPVKAAPADTKAVATKPGAAPAPAAAPAGAALVQLGAFNSEAVASKAWGDMQRRYAFLKSANRTITAASVGGGTVYRLRASVADKDAADSICSRMKAAGENCMVVR